MAVVSDYATFEGAPIIDAEGLLRRMPQGMCGEPDET